MPDDRFPSRLAPEDIARIRADHPILDVLHRYGIDPPPATGTSDFMISCPRPSHPDSTPSCVVHPSTDRFYCFGCGAHGDVFTLITELTGVTSLATIAEILESGRPLSGRWSGPTSRPQAVMAIEPASGRPVLERTSRSRVLEVNAEAWRFLTAPRLADRGRVFLARRGIDVWNLETEVGQPLIGHTPADRRALTAHLRRCGFKPDEIVDSGWAARRDGSLHDRFRGGVLVPVRDADSHVVGVIGRDITDRARQKYLNTASTVAFSKGSLLYRPTLTPVSSDASIVICEGPLDALAIAATAVHSSHAGLIVPVALSGTAITADQARAILALSPNQPILCADGDAAGQAAADRWLMALLLVGDRGLPRRLTLADGHDPASWLRQHGTAGLDAFAAARQAVLDPNWALGSRPTRPQQPQPEPQQISW